MTAPTKTILEIMAEASVAYILWPLTLVWWAFDWIAAAVAVYLMFLGLQRVVERR